MPRGPSLPRPCDGWPSQGLRLDATDLYKHADDEPADNNDNNLPDEFYPGIAELTFGMLSDIRTNLLGEKIFIKASENRRRSASGVRDAAFGLLVLLSGRT